MSLDLDATVDLDSSLYGLDGESRGTVAEDFPRARYRERARTFFDEGDQ